MSIKQLSYLSLGVLAAFFAGCGPEDENCKIPVQAKNPFADFASSACPAVDAMATTEDGKMILSYLTTNGVYAARVWNGTEWINHPVNPPGVAWGTAAGDSTLRAEGLGGLFHVFATL